MIAIKETNEVETAWGVIAGARDGVFVTPDQRVSVCECRPALDVVLAALGTDVARALSAKASHFRKSHHLSFLPQSPIHPEK